MSTPGKKTITHEEAIEFVKQKLCIPDPKLNVGTLDRIQRNLMSEMPFQNISLIASPPERRFPTIEDVISDGLALRGGSCILNNWFLYLILKAMGYDVFTIAATYCGIEDVPNGHMMVVAKGLLDPQEPKCKETLFLVDIASGYPLPGPVPLHRLPVSFPETAGLEVKINISLLASPPEKRFPCIEEVISDGLSLQGGSCILNNWFLYLLLKALRYDVYTIAATYCRVQELPDGHMMVVAKGLLDPEDSECKEPLFLLDAASGFPLPCPVPLHRLPVSFPETAGLVVKMEMIDGLIYRLQHDKDPEPSEKYQMIDGWKVIVKFDLKQKDPLSLRGAMEAIFCPDPPTPLLREVRMFRWPIGKNWCVAVRTHDLIFYGKECPEPDCKFNEKIGKHKKTLNFEDLENTIKRYFPMICHNQLRIALQKIKELKEREKQVHL
ncbi:hypothetical protein J437_LFUL000219 [Ladona fulva]|uniref:arylamine N-acetyltransferase n=1 Tax=Ladona fulva TaxID=123851 RepID=A0A8K0JUJ1_LADFU|nr:hypothetical protein J437_LFUL000219 [Ladona fulva]